jgi:hypothetical protein
MFDLNMDVGCANTPAPRGAWNARITFSRIGGSRNSGYAQIADLDAANVLVKLRIVD